jgi:hypothetical protein
MKPFYKKYDSFQMKIDQDFEKKYDIKIIRLRHTFKLSGRYWFPNLFKIIESFKPDLVFLHGIGDFKDLYMFMKHKNLKIVRDCHMSLSGSHNPFRFFFTLLYKFLFSSIINKSSIYLKVFALGVEEFNYLRSLGIAPSKIQYLFHGFNEQFMYFDKVSANTFRQELSIKKEAILISYVGKHDSYKKPHLIFLILDLYFKQFGFDDRFVILFVGSKNYHYMRIFNKEYIKFKSKHNINIFIKDSSQYVELKNIYSASNISIFPKQTSLSSIHAQVCGSLVIMEDHLSNKERVFDNNNLYKSNDLIAASLKLYEIVFHLKPNQRYIVNFKEREYKHQAKTIRDLCYNIKNEIT